MSTVSVGIDEYGALVKEAAEGGGVPIGTILPYAGSTAPEGTLVCNGAEISRTTYAELFSAIGTTWGEGDGASTFNVPDLRGYFIRGTGGNAGALGAEQGDAIRDITGHFAISSTRVSTPGVDPPGFPAYWLDGAFDAEVDPINNTCLPSSVQNVPAGTSGLYAGVNFHASNVVNTAAENRPINKAVNYIIVYE